MHLFLHSPIRSNTILHYSLNSHMNLNNRQVAIRKKIIDSDFLLHEQMKQTQLLVHHPVREEIVAECDAP